MVSDQEVVQMLAGVSDDKLLEAFNVPISLENFVDMWQIADELERRRIRVDTAWGCDEGGALPACAATIATEPLLGRSLAAAKPAVT